MAETSTRVGIIGLGGIGGTHARALAQLHAEGVPVTVTAFTGGSLERIGEYGWLAATQRSVAELLRARDVDVVAICTPSATHADLTLAALSADRHVVVEKPMALATIDAARIAERARQRGLLVSPLAQRRLEPVHIYVKSLLEEGRLGRVVLGETFVHWHRDDAYYDAVPWRREVDGGSGSLMNQGLHNVDLLCWMLGGAIEVTGQTATLGHDGLPVEDTCVATLRFRNGALGVIVTTTATPPGTPAEMAIWTTTGSLRMSQIGVTEWGFADVPPPPKAASTVTGAADPAAIGIAGHVEQWRDILAALRDGRPPAVGAVDGLDTTATLAGIYQAAAEGRTVSIEAV